MILSIKSLHSYIVCRMSGLLLGQLNGVVFFEKKSDSFKPHVLLKDDGKLQHYQARLSYFYCCVAAMVALKKSVRFCLFDGVSRDAP